MWPKKLMLPKKLTVVNALTLSLPLLLSGCSEEFDVSINLSGKSTADTVTDVTDPTTDDPVVDTPSDPVVDAPSDPVADAPSDPIADAPSDPVVDVPTDTPNDETLFDIASLAYKGGFRVSSGKFGGSAYSTADFSHGAFTVSESGDSIFLASYSMVTQVAEFPIPEIYETDVLSEMAIADMPIQEFAYLHSPETGGHDTGISSHLRITGMAEVDGHLIVNYYNWYDASGAETHTTSVFWDSSDLANSVINGPFDLTGAARSAGWISPVPAEWQDRLGGPFVSGWSQGSIDSRLSNGPSAYFWDPSSTVLQENAAPGPVAATEALNFPLDGILYDKDLYDYSGTWADNEHIEKNEDGNNKLWTYLSGASYGFIVPGYDSYVTVGFSGGHNSTIEYKYQRPDGSYCPGHCPTDATDIANYYWVWRLSDLEKAAKGEILPQDVRPYQYGPLDTRGVTAQLASGDFNPETGRLILSFRSGDTYGTYSRPPLFLVYQVQ